MKDRAVLIVEDELLIAETIADILEQGGYTDIKIVSSVEEAKKYMESKKPSVVLTDINLGKNKNGIDLGQEIFTKYKLPFIYITSHTSTAVIEQVKHTHPNGFIVKPFKSQDLLVAVELALFSKSKSAEIDEREIILRVGREDFKIEIERIIWIESENNYCTVYMNGNQRHVVRISLTEIHSHLNNNFLRIHKSYIVNKKYVSSSRFGYISIGNKEIPVGRTYQSYVSEIFRSAI